MSGQRSSVRRREEREEQSSSRGESSREPSERSGREKLRQSRERGEESRERRDVCREREAFVGCESGESCAPAAARCGFRGGRGGASGGGGVGGARGGAQSLRSDCGATRPRVRMRMRLRSAEERRSACRAQAAAAARQVTGRGRRPEAASGRSLAGGSGARRWEDAARGGSRAQAGGREGRSEGAANICNASAPSPGPGPSSRRRTRRQSDAYLQCVPITVQKEMASRCNGRRGTQGRAREVCFQWKQCWKHLKSCNLKLKL